MNYKILIFAFLAVVLSCLAADELLGTFESCNGVALGAGLFQHVE